MVLKGERVCHGTRGPLPVNANLWSPEGGSRRECTHEDEDGRGNGAWDGMLNDPPVMQEYQLVMSTVLHVDGKGQGSGR